jgi:PilZ domain
VQTRRKFQAAPVRSQSGPDSASVARLRDDARVLVFTVAAMVCTGDQDASWCCAVRDLSQGGARLELDHAEPTRVSEQLPDNVFLHFCPDRTEVECRIAWRDGRHFGVQFMGEINAATRRLA